MAAFHLYEVDAHFAQQPNLDYARYMDDFFIISKTRWHLRRAVRKLNQFFDQFGFHQHPDKTFIDPARKGTDWMGYWLTDQGVQSVAPRALTNHLTKLRRLYEQTRKMPAEQQRARVASYVRRWLKWLACGVFDLAVFFAARPNGRPITAPLKGGEQCKGNKILKYKY